MTVTLELSVNGTVRPEGRYVGWTPANAQLRVADSSPDESGPLQVRLSSPAGGPGGTLDFRGAEKEALAPALDLELPGDGSPRAFQLAGRWQDPSTEDGDAVVEVRRAGGGELIGTFALMVRVRKDANTLTEAERGRFLRALAELNGQGQGLYQSYRDAHREGTLDEAHGFDGFLPWHRAFLLDLERSLQEIDRSVALPYWRFNAPAPNLFTRQFMGEGTRTAGGPVITAEPVRFSPSNPLALWSVDGRVGILRQPSFDTATSGAGGPADGTGPLRTEKVITDFRGRYTVLCPEFEFNPHGSAHVSFSGDIMRPAIAPRDPLFFLLHCNVDRLWATWQWLQKRFDVADDNAYHYRGTAGPVIDADHTRIGHNLLDTMWPWNGSTASPRPPTAPRTPFPGSLLFHEGRPTVGSMIDYQALHGGRAPLGFDYDDVPYQPQNA